MTAVVGILGGTFDPVHNGHLAVAVHLCDGLGLHSVRFVLNAVPPHRIQPACTVEHRLAMLQSALADDDRLIPDTRELERNGPSYSLWTLRSLRGEFPDASLCWIVGADAWMGLRSWYRWYELSSLAHIVVVKRPGWHVGDDRTAGLSLDTSALARRAAGARVLWDGPEADVSASDVRRRIASGGGAAALLPAPVWSYIKHHRLYGYQPTDI